MLTKNSTIQFCIFFIILLITQLELAGCAGYSVDITPICPTFCTGSDINLTANVTGGTQPYTYLWTGPNGFTATTQSINITGTTEINAGEYRVTVTDSSVPPCVVSYQTCVNFKSIFAILNAPIQTVCVGSPVTLTITPFNQTNPYTATLVTNGVPGTPSAPTSDPSISITGTPTVNPTVYSAIITDADGCTAQTNDISITVNQPILPVITLVEVTCDKTIIVTGNNGCPNQMVSLHYNGTQIAVPQIIAADGTFSITSIPLTAGTYPADAVTLETIDCQGCPAATPLPIFTINPTLEVTISPPDVLICQHVPHTLTATASGGVAPYTYQWYFNAGMISGATNTSYTISDPTLANAGNYSVTAVDAVGCTALATQLIIVDAVGVSLSISPNFVCGTSAPTQATLNASVVSGIPIYQINFYQGTPPTGTLIGTQISGSSSPFSISFPVTPPVDPSGPTTVQYYVEVLDGNGCQSTSNVVNIDVNNPPQPIIASATVLCTPQVTITGTAGAGNTLGIFSGTTQVGGPIVVPSTGNFSITTVALDPAGSPYTLTAIATNSFGCSATSSPTLPLTIYPSLTGSITPASPVNVCPGCTQVLTAVPAGGSGTYSYQWRKNSAAIPGATSSTYTISNATSADAGTYSVVITDTGRADATVCTVTPAVIVNITTAVASGRSVICEGTTSSITITVTNNAPGKPPYNYELFIDGNPTPIAVANNVNASQYVFPIGPNTADVTYYAQVTGASPGDCCEMISNLITVEFVSVNPPTVQSIVTNCDGSVTFSGTGDPSVTLTVSYLSGVNVIETAVPVISDATGAFTITTVPLARNTYSFIIRATDANCCFADITTIPITVTEPMILNIAGPSVVCAGTAFNLLVGATNGVPPYTVTWTGPNATRILPTSANITIDNPTQADSGFYVATVTDSHTPMPCSQQIGISVLVDSMGVCLSGSVATICPGQQTTLTAQIIGGIAPYTVSFSDGFSQVITSTTISHTVSPTTTTNYVVSVTDSSGALCNASALTTITVTPLDVTLLASPPTLCTGQASTLTAFIAGSTPPYNVTFSDGFTVVGATSEIVQHVVMPTSSTNYSVSVDNGRGCDANSNIVSIPVTALTPAIITNADDNCDGIITVSGITDPGNTVSVIYNGLEIGIPVIADVNGNFVIRTVALPDGTYTLQIKVSNSVDCTAITTITETIDCSAVTIVITDPRCSVSDGRPVINGITTPSTLVEIYINDTWQETVISDATGNFYYTPQTPLPDGRYTFRAETAIRDGSFAISNTVIVVVDTVVRSSIAAAAKAKYCPDC